MINDEVGMDVNALAEAGHLNFLDPKKIRFEQHEAQLRLTVDGELCCTGVQLARAFPLSYPDQYISVRSGPKVEIGMLRTLKDIEPVQRKLLEAEIERRYVIPIITRVLIIKERFGTVEWTVETTRGKRQFTTRDMRENVTRPAPGRYVLTDVDGNRYDIPDMDEMDGRSREQLLEVL